MANWSEVKNGSAVDRMSFHLEKMDEAIKSLEEVGLDIVAKKLRDAHIMVVRDLIQKWTPDDMIPDIAVVITKGSNTDNMSAEDIIKELQKVARKNSNIGGIFE